MLLLWLRKLLALFSPPPPPRRCTVGAALDVNVGAGADDEMLPLLAAILAVDRVHADGDLPVIPLRREALKNRHGQFAYRQGGLSLGITVHRDADHPALTTLHEIGHFLDYQALGLPLAWASSTDPALAAWREAVKASAAVQRLGQAMNAPDGRLAETLPKGIVVEYTVNLPYVRYLLRPEELWARSYAQFIATRSGDELLSAELDQRRKRRAKQFHYGEHWDDADFAPIAVEIGALLRQRGWME